MEKRTLTEIIQFESIDLTTLIYNWKECEPNTVVLAYAELKRRKFELDDKLFSRLNEFCKKIKYDNIDLFLTATLNASGYKSYEECYEKGIYSIKKISVERNAKIDIGTKNLSEIEIDSSNITLKKSDINAAGRSLKSIVYTAIILIVCIAVGIYISFNSKNLETINNTFMFIGIFSLICNIIILNCLYTAGNHLENS